MPAKSTIFQRISDDAVQAKTDRLWPEWFRILDKFGLKGKGHTQSAKYLREKHGLSDWWAQAVTIRYEWERGLRDGKFNDMKTKPSKQLKKFKAAVQLKDIKPKKDPKAGRQTPKTDFGTVLRTGVATPPP